MGKKGSFHNKTRKANSALTRSARSARPQSARSARPQSARKGLTQSYFNKAFRQTWRNREKAMLQGMSEPAANRRLIDKHDILEAQEFERDTQARGGLSKSVYNAQQKNVEKRMKKSRRNWEKKAAAEARENAAAKLLTRQLTLRSYMEDHPHSSPPSNIMLPLHQRLPVRNP
jgi:hypothetical protein